MTSSSPRSFNVFCLLKQSSPTKCCKTQQPCLRERHGAPHPCCPAFTTQTDWQWSQCKWSPVNRRQPVHHQTTNDDLWDSRAPGVSSYTAAQTRMESAADTCIQAWAEIHTVTNKMHTSIHAAHPPWWRPDCWSHQGPVKHYPLCDSSHSRNSLCNVFLPPPSLLHNSALNNTLHFCWHK